MNAENITYAIKSRVLKNLLEELMPITLPTQNQVSGKKLSEQIRQIKNYVLLIEVE
jgi:hypothetical protein